MGKPVRNPIGIFGNYIQNKAFFNNYNFTLPQKYPE